MEKRFSFIYYSKGRLSTYGESAQHEGLSACIYDEQAQEGRGPRIRGGSLVGRLNSESEGGDPRILKLMYASHTLGAKGRINM